MTNRYENLEPISESQEFDQEEEGEEYTGFDPVDFPELIEE